MDYFYPPIVKVPSYFQTIQSTFFWKRLDNIINLTNLKGKKVLDVGCGPCVLIPSLAESAKEVVGVDIVPSIRISKYLFEKYYKLENVKIFRGSIFNLKLPSNHFDIILCLDVLEHLKNVEKAILELNRVLAHNGECIISIPIENIGLSMGRSILRKKKPEFHYVHEIKSHNEMIALIKKHFEVKQEIYFPNLIFKNLSLFVILRLIKK